MESSVLKVGIILPSYNVAVHLPTLLGELHRTGPGYHCLVVDDGSGDGTAEVAAAAGATVIRHTVNQGKGAALLSGYKWALAQQLDWVYTMDADGQHLPAEMGAFLDAALSRSWDVVVGTRMSDTATMPWLRKVTNQVTSRVVSWLCGIRIPDSQSGYRLFRTVCLAGLRLRTRRYDSESEVLVRLARKGAAIGSVPISTVYGQQHSSIRPLLDTWRFLRLVLMLMFDRA